MKKILLPIIGAALMMAACDKIPEGEYTVFSGINATWSDGDGVEAIQRAYVEKYTGPTCTNCPLADETLDAAHETFGERLVVVSINHYEGQGKPFAGEPDMRTDGGTAWCKYFGINSLPSAYLNRNTSKQYTSSMGNIVTDIATAIAQQPVLGIGVSAKETNVGEISIGVDIQMAQAYTKPMTLTLALIEDSLAYKQSTPNGTDAEYVHNHMLRDVLTDFWGVDVQGVGAAGEKRHASFGTYSVKDENIKLENCHIVAFVSDKASKQVLNVAQCGIE